VKVVFRNIGMEFGSVRVLDDINLSVAAGEFLCILGPSGCGKSTLLNIAGGFVKQTGGEVAIDGEPVTGPDPRRIFVFQERGVFPWLTVEQNIGFGLFKQSESEARAHRAYVQLVGLKGFEKSYPRELSGGMKQRLEVARARGSPDAVSRQAVRRAGLDHAPADAPRAAAHLARGTEDDPLRHTTSRSPCSSRTAWSCCPRAPAACAASSTSTSRTRATSATRATSRFATRFSARSAWLTRYEGRRQSRRQKELRDEAHPSSFILALLITWQIAVVATGTKIFPSPVDVLRGLNDLPHLGAYARDSLFRVFCGYSAAVILGIPVGLTLGWWSSLAKAMNPLIQMLRPISPLAWMPLAVIWFGISNLAPIFLIFLASFFPVVLAAMNGVRNVPPMYVRRAQLRPLSTIALMTRVIFPRGAAAHPRRTAHRLRRGLAESSSPRK
jgi:ABC-type transport system involved in cytochrome c biogenesis ATPase subunit